MKFALAILLIFSTAAWAEETFTVPALTGPVVDSAGMLSDGTSAKLERFLRRLHDQGGTQIQILTVPNLGGLSIEEASIKVTDKWKLGGAKEDNGILLMLSQSERRVRIEVGQGYEGDLPDAIASRIVRDVIIPRFKQGDIDQGVIDGVLSITHYVNPSFLEGQNSAGVKGERPQKVSFGKLIMVLFFFFFLLPILFGRRARRSGLTGALIGYGLGGGFRGGGGDWGGGSGGGWSGGGGGFSGGGASGSW